ncbi:hypothetical protein EMCRGX_G032123 [Ephydatia muelleri]|eukprot:Em0019g706a
MARNIYFAGSIRAGRADVEIYAHIVKLLKRYGAVLTEHVADSKIDENGKEHENDQYIHDRDMAWLEKSDVIVAEVTQPSLGVGYEIGRAVDLNKRILCLFRPETGKRLSAMIRGAHNGSTFTVKDYSIDQAEGILENYFSALS